MNPRVLGIGLVVALLVGVVVVFLDLWRYEPEELRPDAAPEESRAVPEGQPRRESGEAESREGAAAPVAVERPEPTVDGPRLVGRVLDPEGRGVPGAELVLMATRSAPGLFSREAGARSDSDGSYVLPADSLRPGEAAGAFLDIEADGFASGRESLHDILESGGLDEGEARELDVRLGRGRRVSGRVVHHLDDRPIPEVEVVLFRFHGRNVKTVVGDDGLSRRVRAGLGPTPLERARTDSEGRFVFPAVPTGATLPPRRRGEPWGAAEVRIAGQAPSARAIPFGDDDEELEIRVLPGVRIVGRVVDVDGTPLPGAIVSLQMRTARMVFVQPNAMFDRDRGFDNAWEPGEGRGSLGTVADAEGRFAFPPVPRPTGDSKPGGIGVRRPDDDPRGGGWYDRDFRVPDDVEVHDVGDLRLRGSEPAVDLRIETRDETGKPIPGTRLTISGQSRGLTDESGAYRLILPQLEDGTVPRQDAEFRRRGHVMALVTIGPRVESPFVVTMPRAKTLEGRLLFSDGAPAPGGYVYFHPTETRLGWNWGLHDLGFAAEKTDGTGRWRLDGLPEEAFTLEARWDRDGFAPQRKTWRFERVPDGEQLLRFDAPRPALGRARLSFGAPDGTPIDGGVGLSLVDERGDRRGFGIDRGSEWRSDDLPAGPYRFEAWHEDHPALFGRIVIPAEGEVTRHFVFPAPCRCRVLVGGGFTHWPLPLEATRDDGARVRQDVETGKPLDLLLAPGTWSFRVVRQADRHRAVLSRSPVTVQLTPDAEAEVRLELKPLAVASITFAEGVDVRGTSWRLEIGDFRWPLQRYVPMPRSENVVVPAGRAVWRVVGPEGVRWEGTVDVPDNGRHEVTVR